MKTDRRKGPRKKDTLVYGVGINDADYVLSEADSYYVEGKRKQRIIWACPFYVIWKGVLQRCYSQKSLLKYPSYMDCSVCEEWLRFSNFKAWMEQQNWEDKQLDKDLLVNGNKVYSPATCIFVSRRLNSFLLPEEYLINSKKSGLPLGVVFDRCGFRCQVSKTTNNNQHVKIFKTAEEAHAEWVRVKMQILEEILIKEDISESAINTIRNNLHKRMNIE